MRGKGGEGRGREGSLFITGEKSGTVNRVRRAVRGEERGKDGEGKGRREKRGEKGKVG